MINEGGSKFDAKGGSVLDANQQAESKATHFYTKARYLELRRQLICVFGNICSVTWGCPMRCVS